MKKNPNPHVIGVDFGSDSVRCLIVDATDGKEISSAVRQYPRWAEGLYCNPSENRYRQHPLDYTESLEAVVREALDMCDESIRGSVCGISFDTTASTPVLTDINGTPLSLLPEYADNPDAMFVLWKDHTAIEEADEINRTAKSCGTDYTAYCGGSYSCEWVWAKMLHCLRNTPELRAKAYSWVEHCDWISAILTGDTTPGKIARSRCVAGHKAMWHEKWGGLPPKAFFSGIDPLFDTLTAHMYSETCTSNKRAGTLCRQWAEKLGLHEGIAVGTGAIDCHMGAVGAGIKPGTLVKVMGTSTCDIAVSDGDRFDEYAIRGICGQVNGSVLPDCTGIEAGQSAFGDIYAWFRRVMEWPLKQLADADSSICDRILIALTEQAEALPLSPDDMVATDWFNGRRTPDADPRAKGAMDGLTLATTAPQIFKALVEATAFGSRAINERLIGEGVEVNEIIAVGGISKKSGFVMQTLCDVIGMPIKVLRSEQACALGSAMYAAVVAGIYHDIVEAQQAMGSGFSNEYRPDMSRHAIYDKLYGRYLTVGNRVAK